MTNEISKKGSSFSLGDVSNLSEAKEVATMLATSGMVPNCYKGKAADVLICVDYGKGLGFSPLQALQSIAVINGTPSIYGDGMIALVRNHPEFADMHEPPIENGVASCTVKRMGRHGMQEVTAIFSIEDAKKANLWGKKGPWSDYPNRMLKMRARGFALRDMFADALKGMKMAEEVEDYSDGSRQATNNTAKEKLAGMIKSNPPRKVVTEVELEPEVISVGPLFVKPDDDESESGDRAADTEVLKNLIRSKEITGDVIQMCMEKGNVTSIDELKHKTIKALINKYGSKDKING